VADIASDRTDDYNFDILEKAKNHVTHLAPSIRATNDFWSFQHEASVIEIDMSLPQSPIAFLVVP
jgi:hypothetical protein